VDIVEDNMPSVILGMLVNEHERLKEVLPLYQKNYEELPKGSLVVKKKGNDEYAYRKYKEGGRQISQYLGLRWSPAYIDMDKKLARSHYLLREIRDMKHQVEDLEMAIRIIKGREERRWRRKESSMNSVN
jgi:hypothetical protein